MLLFKEEHVEPILLGQKTETRRIWKRRRVCVGALHLAYTRPPFCTPPGEPFARLLIRAHWEEEIDAITLDGARAEGYPDTGSYLKAFLRINQIKRPSDVLAALKMNVHVVRFQCEEDLTKAQQ